MADKIIPVLLGMMLVTYLPRVLPLVILSRFEIPPLILNWLKFIPVAVLASLLAPELLLKGIKLDFSLQNSTLLAAFPAILTAVLSKNLFYTVFVGMGMVVILERFIV